MFKEGWLDEVLQVFIVQVWVNLVDVKCWVFLFQLFVLLGQWEWVQNQFIVVGELDLFNVLMVGVYNVVLIGECECVEVLEGWCVLVIIGELVQWVVFLLQVFKFNVEGCYVQVVVLCEQVFEQVDVVGGSIDGVVFEWMVDVDLCFGFCLEVIIKSGYVWVLFLCIKEFIFEVLSDLCDKIWVLVQIIWVNGGQVIGFVFVCYFGVDCVVDGEIVLVWCIDWFDLGDDFQVVQGQCMLVIDVGEYLLFDVCFIMFDLG